VPAVIPLAAPGDPASLIKAARIQIPQLMNKACKLIIKKLTNNDRAEKNKTLSPFKHITIKYFFSAFTQNK
jgi:hypothetical protein